VDGRPRPGRRVIIIRVARRISGGRACIRVLLVSALADLSPDERELIEAKYMNQQTVREIAQARGASEKAIESRLTRVRRHLRDELLSRLWQRKEHENPQSFA
jgi:DNA-directed RNA polymerase specialized sigma24 family protein